MKKIYLTLCIVYTLTILTVLTVKDIQADVNYLEYLDRAANANSCELCLEQLETAIASIEERGLTNGYTSILYNSPNENLTFWYTNIITCRDELLKVDENTTQLETSNLLLKVRESLTTRGENGSSVVIYPSGISLYPNNTLWCVLIWLILVVWLMWIPIYWKEFKMKIDEKNKDKRLSNTR